MENKEVLSCEDFSTEEGIKRARIEGIVRSASHEEENKMFYGFIEELAQHYKKCLSSAHKVRTDTIFYSFVTHLSCTPEERDEMIKFYKERREKWIGLNFLG